MNHYSEWIIQYHGDLQKALQGTDTMFDTINERYAIVKIREKEVSYLKSLMQIEYIEESRPICQVKNKADLAQIISKEKEKQGVSGKGVTVGWISHNEDINYNYYNTCDGETRFVCIHNGINEYNKEQIKNIGRSCQGDGLSSMDSCIGNKGIAPDSDVILVNWQKSRFYTADAIRAVRFMIARSNSIQKPLVIYLPFDISNGDNKNNNLIREIISDMTLWGKIIIVSNLEAGSETLKINLGLNRGPIFSTYGELTVGALSLLMEWGIVRMNEPSLYGQKLRTYYIKNVASQLKKDNLYTRVCSIDSIDELIKLLIPMPIVEEFRTLDLAYALAPEDAEIDAFIFYNNLKKYTTIIIPKEASLYPLVFPYLGVRGTVAAIKELLSDSLEMLITGSLAYILGNEPLEIKATEFKAASILNTPTDLKGANTLIGIIDTGIDYTHPAFIDAEGKTRIVSIWDQTIGEDSPYGYGTIYDQEIINEALQSPNPFEVVPHKDEWGHGTILAGIAAGDSKDEKGVYKGVAPEAGIIVVKLVSATPAMQEIYHGKYNLLGFSALDIARSFEYLSTLANQHQKPISICLPMGTNSGPHDGTSILDTIIMSYAEKPGVTVILPAGEEANKAHHASGDLKEKSEQEIKLTISQGQDEFIIEVWAMFGDKIEVLLMAPKLDGGESTTILLNKAQIHKITNTSFVWSQGSKIDMDTGCQVIRFRLGNPLYGDWTIRVKGIIIIWGRYDIWIPKTGMILPHTVLSPADPFTTIYNTSASNGLITVVCYDKKSSSATPSSGRGFARDDRVKPDFMVPGVDIPGPLPGNEWGTITGTGAASAITVGVASLIYEKQLLAGEELANTITMKALLVENVKREPTMSYPNRSRGYGLLDISAVIYK
ncbi:MAG TPA: S8 family serine peptidase [Epulopiscium sp.]|nr:S8 family serine peptidase [Candidatus Epulonipiscium sp.]